MEKTLLQVTVTETGENRDYWATRPYVGDQAAAVRAADLIVAPWEDFREGQPVLFPESSSDLIAQLREAFGDRMAVAVDAEGYAEIALYGKASRLPTLIVTTLLLPALAGALGDTIHDRFAGAPPAATVEMRVVVEGDHGRCISVEYKGPPDRALETVMSEVDRCLPGGGAATPAPAAPTRAAPTPAPGPRALPPGSADGDPERLA